MQKAHFIGLFIGMHVIFIVLQIHKQSSCIKLSYDKQRLEKERRELLAYKDILTERLSKLQDPEGVKQYALSKLQMKHISLNQIRHTNGTNKL